MNHKGNDNKAEQIPEPTLFRCPVCKKPMAAISTPELTGWLRCCYNHKTTYRNGIPIETTKNGNPIGTAS